MIELRGLRINNPQAVMASYGLLRVQHHQGSEARLHWRDDNVAVLDDMEWAHVVEIVTQYLERREDAPELHWTGSLNRFDREQYRKLCRESDARAREWVDGYWYDANREDGAAAWSKLDTTVGSRASLCGSVRDALALIRKQGIEVALRRTLLEPWASDDDAATTGWDPAAVKLGASITGGKEPSGAKHRTVAAATWLAWESLPLFPARWIAGERDEVVFVVPHRPVSLAGARMMLLSGPRMDGAELRGCESIVI